MQRKCQCNGKILIRKLSCGWKFTCINVAVCAIVNFVVFGFDKLKILPAARIREGIMMPTLKLSAVNTVMVAFLVIGFALVLLLNLRADKKKA